MEGEKISCNIVHQISARSCSLPNLIDFQTDPSRYRHWRVDYDGPVANLIMDVDEDGGLFRAISLS